MLILGDGVFGERSPERQGEVLAGVGRMRDRIGYHGMYETVDYDATLEVQDDEYWQIIYRLGPLCGHHST